MLPKISKREIKFFSHVCKLSFKSGFELLIDLIGFLILIVNSSMTFDSVVYIEWEHPLIFVNGIMSQC